MTAPEEDQAAARLLERLLSDPAYREAFRADPVRASRAAGVDSVAEEMAAGRGKVLQTLDDRESRSSLAGVLMAAALEGAAIVDFSKDVLPHLEEVPKAVGDVLTGLQLPGVEDAEAATPQRAGVEPLAGEFRVVTPRGGAGAGASAAAAEADPAQSGQGRAGGGAASGALDILDDKRISFDADGIADIKAGRIDPRVLSVLEAVAKDHKISISAMRSDHDQFTSGGSVSNHYVGRAVDIAVVDGQPVSPGNSAARELANSLASLPESIRPSEVGSPWQLPGTADFTDSAHQNHVHIGFDDPLPSDWRPPAGLDAGGGDSGAVGPPAAGPGEVQELPAVDTAEPAEPGGLEDPGGDTDAEADAESDGDDNDSVADDASDEEEDDEGDGGEDGDHDDNSDSGSDDSGDSDGSDGGGEEVDGGGDQPVGAAPDLGDPGIVAGGYPGDSAPQAQLAAWMGAAAQKRGLPAELPVMASLVESNVRNLNYGDADSVGFFQMRVSVWNNGDYAGYADRPQLQLKWFLDQAEAVKRQRQAAGKSVTNPNSYGDWIADIERPAEQYRGRYQLRLDEARDLLRQGSAHRGGGGGGGGGDGAGQLEPVSEGLAGGAGGKALRAVAAARGELGTPYQWGGSTPQTGFDCSGLMQWAYAKVGIRIPRTSEQQILASNATPVRRNALRPGDLVFFRDSTGDVHHVGMSLGGDRFIQAPHTGDVVKISSLKEPYYAQQYTGARRFDMSSARAVRAVSAPASGERLQDGAAAVAAAAGDGVDQAAVQDAEAALLRDAAEVQKPGTLLFEAVRAQEAESYKF